jgi:hypothetical protein
MPEETKRHYAFRPRETPINTLDFYRQAYKNWSSRTEMLEEAITLFIAYLEHKAKQEIEEGPFYEPI